MAHLPYDDEKKSVNQPLFQLLLKPVDGGNVTREDLTDQNKPEDVKKFVEKLIEGQDKNRKFMIFLHGYNNSTEYAEKVFLKLDKSLDKRQNGRIISCFFDWDGKESMKAFDQAVENAKKAVPFLRECIKHMFRKGYKNLVFLAHSLGNKLLISTICDAISKDKIDFSTCSFVSFASAASVEEFDEAIELLRGKYHRWISYCNTKDVALFVESWWKWMTPMGNRVIFTKDKKTNKQDEKFECVDTSVLSGLNAVLLFPLVDRENVDVKNHTYLLNKYIVYDFQQAILKDKKAQYRTQLVQKFDAKDHSKWHYSFTIVPEVMFADSYCAVNSV